MKLYRIAAGPAAFLTAAGLVMAMSVAPVAAHENGDCDNWIGPDSLVMLDKGGDDDCDQPTVAPSEEPTAAPSEEPTAAPSEEPSAAPSEEPSVEPSQEPSSEPSADPSSEPTGQVEAETGTPKVTLPPTDAAGTTGGDSGSSTPALPLVLIGLGSLALVLAPKGRNAAKAKNR